MDQPDVSRDLVVVVPGITGSKLTVRGAPVWSLSGRAIMNGVRTLGKNVDQLALPQGFGDSFPDREGEGEPDDGVAADGLMADVHLIPGLWSPIKGYNGLGRFFQKRFGATKQTGGEPGNLIEFAYDWRLSNAVSARRLRDDVMPVLHEWRRQRGDAEAKLVLICHSMGGLVARWFLEKLEGWKDTNWLITIGTPYLGSIDALLTLSNGLSKGLGPIRKDLTHLVRTFPSCYELLPMYDCYIGVDGGLMGVADAPGLDLRTKMLDAARTFHRELAQAVAARPERGYRTVAIKGVTQPTWQTAATGSDGVKPLLERKGIAHGGDGTVPRPSAHPPEWKREDGGDTIGASQKHASLQESDDVWVQLYTRLTTDLKGTFMGGEEIAVQVGTDSGGEVEPTGLFASGQEIVVHASSANETQSLLVAAAPHDTPPDAAPTRLMSNLGDGQFRTRLAGLQPGVYRLDVRTATAKPSAAVSEIVVVWDEPGA